MTTTGFASIGQSSMQVDLTDKRTTSEEASPPYRIDILRPRTSVSNPERTSASIVPKSLFISAPKFAITKTIIPDTVLHPIEAFQFDLRGQASNTALFVSG